jgi:hypothetical protein
MPSSTISQFKTQLRRGGARPNLFEVDITSSTALNDIFWTGTDQDDFHFLCKATSMPTQTIGSVDVPFRGRILKVAGDRTFEPWTVTVINDEEFNVRSSFERWADAINNMESGEGAVSPNDYMGNGTIKQLGRTDIGSRDVGAATKAGGDGKGVLYSYKVQDIWPSEIGSIDLSYESSDAIEEFTVTFQVQYMTINPPAGTATGGGE